MKNYRKLISILGVTILFISLTFVGCVLFVMVEKL